MFLLCADLWDTRTTSFQWKSTLESHVTVHQYYMLSYSTAGFFILIGLESKTVTFFNSRLSYTVVCIVTTYTGTVKELKKKTLVYCNCWSWFSFKIPFASNLTKLQFLSLSKFSRKKESERKNESESTREGLSEWVGEREWKRQKERRRERAIEWVRD